ncbi:hypothetical protein ACMGDM_00015 [Sphingomonas sp. DT-51]|uniref:hypothetical protein n=1 Tax=Sphingomonas sp. DT-51 TaxID=3396165 RepID=UPI003F1B1849
MGPIGIARHTAASFWCGSWRYRSEVDHDRHSRLGARSKSSREHLPRYARRGESLVTAGMTNGVSRTNIAERELLARAMGIILT